MLKLKTNFVDQAQTAHPGPNKTHPIPAPNPTPIDNPGIPKCRTCNKPIDIEPVIYAWPEPKSQEPNQPVPKDGSGIPKSYHVGRLSIESGSFKCALTLANDLEVLAIGFKVPNQPHVYTVVRKTGLKKGDVWKTEVHEPWKAWKISCCP